VRALLVFVGALPWLVALARGLLPLGAFGAALDVAFRPLCHRMPERSLVLIGVTMPVCSRCAGIFAGIALGALVARPRLDVRASRALILAAGLLMIGDVLAQDLGVHPVWHAARLVTGGVFGYALASALAAQLRTT
jgi:uncharacterized membrane protein